MSSPKRKFTYFQSGSTRYCDSSSGSSSEWSDWSGPAWYRVVGGAGTKLNTHVFPKLNYGECNSNRGGWIEGGHPSIPAGVTVTRKIRFDRTGFTRTDLNHDIDITNCNGFFVYNLPGISSCSLRYCTQP